MAFQTSVNNWIGAGVVGELAFEGPLRAQPVRLTSPDAANNVFGRALYVVSGGTGQPLAGDAGANPAPMVARAGAPDNAVTNIFAGILANPKEHANYGTAAAGPFAPNTALPNGEIASAVQECAGIWINAPAAVNVGDLVYALFATGILAFAAPGASVPTGAVLTPIGRIERYTNAGAGIACAYIGPVS